MAGVNIIVCVPDTWAFPQLSLISLIQQFPEDTPLNLTCGNSGPKPGVVFVHAASGAISQYGRLVHINVGTWPDVVPGSEPDSRPGAGSRCCAEPRSKPESGVVSGTPSSCSISSNDRG